MKTDFFTILYNKAPKELKNIIDILEEVNQDTVWHSEGSVLNHTKLVTNRLHNTFNDINLDLCGLFHDLGKIDTTVFDEEKQTYTAHGHEDISLKYVIEFEPFITKLGAEIDLIRFVVENHMRVKFIDTFRLQNKIDLFENEYFEYLIKFNSADFGGNDEICKPLYDTTFLKKEISEYYEKIERNVLINSKLNGNIIMRIFPELKGAELGRFISEFKKYVIINKTIEFETYIIDTETDVIYDELIKFNNLFI